MAYKWRLLPAADRDLEVLDTVIAKRILKKLRRLAAQTDPLRHGKWLSDPMIGDIRFRIGDYRVIIVAEERTKNIIIVAIGHRRDIYQ